MTSPQGIALFSFSDTVKDDWGIVVRNGLINIPDFYSGDRLPFLRCVDGSVRLPGSLEGDAIRNITSTEQAVFTNIMKSPTLSGVFYILGINHNNISYASATNPSSTISALGLDASRQVPTADENRPYNLGVIPAIYLGV
jgi:hypothetical protein